MKYLPVCTIRALILVFLFVFAPENAIANEDKNCASVIDTILAKKKTAGSSYKRKAKNLKRLSAPEEITKQEAAPFVAHLKKVKDKIVSLSRHLVAPDEMKVKLLPADTSPHYDLVEDSLQTTRKLVRVDPYLTQQQINMHVQMGLPLKLYSQHPNFGLAITAHEYGHGILHATLRKDFTQLDEFIVTLQKEVAPLMREYERLNESITETLLLILQKEEAHMDMPALIQGPDGSYQINPIYMAARDESEELKKLFENDPEYKALVKEFMEIQNHMQELKAQNDEIMVWLQKSGNPFLNTMNKIGHYHELFADLIAVVSQEKYDPSIIAKSITTTREIQIYGKRMKDVASHRDFASRNNKIEKWQESEQIHAYFAPTRLWLHENYLKKPSYQSGEKLGKLLDAVYLAIKEHIEIMNENPTALDHMKPRELNQFFIESIEKHMK